MCVMHVFCNIFSHKSPNKNGIKLEKKHNHQRELANNYGNFLWRHTKTTGCVNFFKMPRHFHVYNKAKYFASSKGNIVLKFPDFQLTFTL